MGWAEKINKRSKWYKKRNPVVEAPVETVKPEGPPVYDLSLKGIIKIIKDFFHAK